MIRCDASARTAAAAANEAGKPMERQMLRPSVNVEAYADRLLELTSDLSNGERVRGDFATSLAAARGQILPSTLKGGWRRKDRTRRITWRHINRARSVKLRSSV